MSRLSGITEAHIRESNLIEGIDSEPAGAGLPVGRMAAEPAPPSGSPSRYRFVCPVCGRGSAHPDDARYGYCGACHDYTGQGVGDTEGGVHHMSMCGALGSGHDRCAGTPTSAMMGVPGRPFDGGGDAPVVDAST